MVVTILLRHAMRGYPAWGAEQPVVVVDAFFWNSIAVPVVVVVVVGAVKTFSYSLKN